MMTLPDFILRTLARYRSEDDGAVTVDWVVVTALVVTLGLAAAMLWRDTAGKVATDIASTTTDYGVVTTFD